jgi:hypothetical protein
MAACSSRAVRAASRLPHTCPHSPPWACEHKATSRRATTAALMEAGSPQSKSDYRVAGQLRWCTFLLSPLLRVMCTQRPRLRAVSSSSGMARHWQPPKKHARHNQLDLGVAAWPQPAHGGQGSPGANFPGRLGSWLGRLGSWLGRMLARDLW